MEALEEQREQVAAASRRLAAEGLVPGTAGNVSARHEERVAISPTGAVLAELEAVVRAIVHVASTELQAGRLTEAEVERTMLTTAFAAIS